MKSIRLTIQDQFDLKDAALGNREDYDSRKHNITRTTSIIQSRNPDAFHDDDSLKNRMFYHRPRSPVRMLGYRRSKF